VQEQREAVGARPEDGKWGVRFRVAALEDRDQRTDQVVAAVGALARALGFAHQVRLQSLAGLGTSPYCNLTEVSHQAGAWEDLELVSHSRSSS
jgi:hypothetical protein